MAGFMDDLSFEMLNFSGDDIRAQDKYMSPLVREDGDYLEIQAQTPSLSPKRLAFGEESTPAKATTAVSTRTIDYDEDDDAAAEEWINSIQKNLDNKLSTALADIQRLNHQLADKDTESAEKKALLLAIKSKLLELSEIRAEANNQPVAFKLNALQVLISILTLGAAYFYFKAKHYEEQTKKDTHQLGLFQSTNYSLKRNISEIISSIPENPTANP